VENPWHMMMIGFSLSSAGLDNIPQSLIPALFSK
jgi:hypothetical protein